MQVYEIDRFGVWTGESSEHKQKERLSGVIHAPPALSSGQFAQWRGHVWVVLDGYPVEPLKREMLARVADKRWRVETGGITISGMTVATDRESQGLIDGAARLAAREPDETIKFKAATGWVTLDAATMDAIAVAIGRHVRQCFAREAELSALIDAADTQQELDAVNIETGWPGQ